MNASIRLEYHTEIAGTEIPAMLNNIRKSYESKIDLYRFPCNSSK